MKSTFSKYKYHNGNRLIGGTAAYNHFFKENGGIDHVLEQVAKESAAFALREVMNKSKV